MTKISGGCQIKKSDWTESKSEGFYAPRLAKGDSSRRISRLTPREIKLIYQHNLMSDKKYQNAKQKVLAIEEEMSKYGTNQWYTDKGKLIANGNNDRETQKEVMKIIKKNKEKFVNTNVINVHVDFYTDEKTLMNKKKGGIKVIVSVYTIKTVLGKIAPQLRR